MIARVIDLALGNRLMVLLMACALAAAGIWAIGTTHVDAIPDLSDVQVIVLSKYPGQAPQVVEDQVTYPLTTALLGVPKATAVRGFSFFGLSFIYIIFEDGTDLYWARSRVLEYLNYVGNRLPAEVTPTLGPDATGAGWIYEYALVDSSGQHDLAALRSIQDWYLRYPLQTVPGIAEIASVGGYVKQYQVEVNPQALAAYKIPLAMVQQAIMQSNRDAGGRLLEMSETEYMVRSFGSLRSLEDLQQVAVSADEYGTPIRVRDIAQVQFGPELRRGVAELNGQGEVVGGIVIMRYGENARSTITAVREKLRELAAGLPDGVEIVPVYDRSGLIDRAIDNLHRTLLAELGLVALVCMLFLLHLRSSLAAIAVLPFGILMAFLAMRMQGIDANIMSLGGIAIAIGAMIDGPIVLIENAHRHLARAGAKISEQLRRSLIRKAALEVGPALFFSLLVVVASYLAIFTLEGQEGRLFKPLAFTGSYSMLAAAVLAVTLVPIAMILFIRGRIPDERANPITRTLQSGHRILLTTMLRWRKTSLALALILLAATAYPIAKLGSEFMPPLDEGDILYMPTSFPGISITKAKELLQQTDRILAGFPEVHSVFGKVGRAETATDPAPLSMLETTVRLKPRHDWPEPSKSTDELMQEMDRAIRFPGLANSWTMPIKTRLDMLSTGIKTPVGVKISGPDLQVLQHIAEDIEQILGRLPETRSAFGDRAAGGYFLDFDIDREALARHGLSVDKVQDLVMTAIGGRQLTEIIDGLERYPVNLRYPSELRDDPEKLARVLIATPSGAQIPLGQVVSIHLRRGAAAIKSEGARPNAWVYVDLNSSDIGGFVAKAKKVLKAKLELPEGYAITWSGQFEFMQRAKERLRVVIPLSLLLIFALLYWNFGTILAPSLVMLSVPFALIGGFWLVYWAGFNLSVAVAIGFLALAGIAVETGVLVISFIQRAVDERRREKHAQQPSATAAELALQRHEVIHSVALGSSRRVRAVAMTASSTIAGLLPIMFLNGTGSELMQRIAAPMIGGMLTTAVLSLLILPVVCSLLIEWQERRKGKNKRLLETA